MTSCIGRRKKFATRSKTTGGGFSGGIGVKGLMDGCGRREL